MSEGLANKKNVIPAITDPLGRYWDQPNPEEIAIDDKTAVMSKVAYNLLPRYDGPAPTGTYVGKMWKSQGNLCWFDRIEGPNIVIEARKIIIVK
jgi:hypothetical protein